jgi:hypothetical protein
VERDRWEDQDEDGRIILKLILMKQFGNALTGFFWLRVGTSGEHGIEPSGSKNSENPLPG